MERRGKNSVKGRRGKGRKRKKRKGKRWIGKESKKGKVKKSIEGSRRAKENGREEMTGKQK